MHGAPDIDRACAITGKVCWFQDSRRDDGSKQLAIPAAMVTLRNCTSIRGGEDLTDALLDELERLPVATGRQGIVMSPVALECLRVPVAEADALDEIGADL